MKTQVTSRAGSMRPVQWFFVAAYLVMVVSHLRSDAIRFAECLGR